MQHQQQGCKRLLLSVLSVDPTGTLFEGSLQMLQQWQGCTCNTFVSHGAYGT